MLTNSTSDLSWLVDKTRSGSVESQSSVKAGGFRKMYLAALASLLFAVSMGMAGAYSATATDDMKKPRSGLKPTDEDISWIGSLVALGALFGGIAAGYMADKIGRKNSLICLSLPFLTGWLLIAYASNLQYIFAGRFIQGVCAGIICAITPAYLVEIATSDVRGMLGSSFQLFVALGVLIGNAIGTALSWNWQAISSTPSLILGLFLICFVPESPRWLIAEGRYQEAIDAIKFLQRPDFDAVAEFVSIYEDITLNSGQRISWKELRKPGLYKPTILAVSLLLFQQLCGANTIVTYTVQVFKASSTPISEYESTILLNFVLLIATATSSLLLDRAGRKLLLILSSLGMFVSLLVLSGFTYARRSNAELVAYSWVPLVFILTYMIAFSLGFGPITWLMVAEMSPTRARGFIVGVSSAFCWTFFFIVTKTFITLEHYIYDSGTYLVYGTCSLVSCIFVVLCLPETKGKSLEDIQRFFSSDVDRKNALTTVEHL